MDVPFDELYHAEKQVIQDVIDAEKALKAFRNDVVAWEFLKKAYEVKQEPSLGCIC